MTTERADRGRRRSEPVEWSPQRVGLDLAMYSAALDYLFDRAIAAQPGEGDWFWNIDEPVLEATPLEWTRIQTLVFGRAGSDLARYSNDQIGGGLNYLMSNALSNVPFAAIDASVPVDDAMLMMTAMPVLWRECIGPRLVDEISPIGSSESRLSYVCYMWFDVWPTFWQVRHDQRWNDAVWNVLRDMLGVPCRAVQVAGLHGIGHLVEHLDRQVVIDRAVGSFIRSLDGDDELAAYADAARRGSVQ